VLGLSPFSITIVVVVALVLLGPEKLPGYARQAGAAWKALRELQERVEGELRESVPDLPKTSDIARYARSPVSLLNKLADHVSDPEGAAAPADDAATAPQAGFVAPGGGVQADAPERPGVAWGDPSLN